VRWVGNEKGIAGEPNWNTISTDTLYAGKAGIENLLNTGSENGNKWIPAEVDVSIRPGWFYHADQDSLVKSPEKLFDIYLTSVGRGSTLLLNIPPDQRGLVHENDVAALQGFRKILDETFKTDLALHAKTEASSQRSNAAQFSSANLTDGNKESYWTTDDNIITASIEIDLEKNQTIKYIELQEYIKLGQRVKSFTIEVWKDNAWKVIAQGTTIGYKRIVKIDPIETTKVKVNIVESKACPVLTTISMY
jgi:alpha-L-fucosidase